MKKQIERWNDLPDQVPTYDSKQEKWEELYSKVDATAESEKASVIDTLYRYLWKVFKVHSEAYDFSNLKVSEIENIESYIDGLEEFIATTSSEYSNFPLQFAGGGHVGDVLQKYGIDTSELGQGYRLMSDLLRAYIKDLRFAIKKNEGRPHSARQSDALYRRRLALTLFGAFRELTSKNFSLKQKETLNFIRAGMSVSGQGIGYTESDARRTLRNLLPEFTSSGSQGGHERHSKKPDPQSTIEVVIPWYYSELLEVVHGINEDEQDNGNDES
jgi:hypothetical protein